MSQIELNKRQEEIISIVKENGPITGEQIAERLNFTRATLRPDLAILTMSGYLEARPRVGYFYSGKKKENAALNNYLIMRVKDHQSKPVLIKESITVYEAICLLFSEDVGSLFVVDENEFLIGVISRKDLLKTSLGKQDIYQMPAHIMMTRMPNIAFCLEEDLLVTAAKKLIEKQVDALPVVQEVQGGYRVVGRVTKTNITKAYLSFAPHSEH